MSAPACISASVAVCVGKDCRAAKGFDKLVEAVAGTKHPKQVPCQENCKGPVVGLKVDGEIRWYERVRTKELRKAVLRAVERGELSAALRKVELKSKRGKVRHARQMRALKG
jgi:(2Fe-2S) ferredoxin